MTREIQEIATPHDGDIYYPIQAHTQVPLPPSTPGTGSTDGPAAVLNVEGIDPDPPLMIPGPSGSPGGTGPTGAAGASGPMMIVEPMDPEPAMMIPGIPGVAGSAGAAGAPGQTIYIEPEMPEDVYPIPGRPGTDGAAGAAGRDGAAIYLVAEPIDPDSPMLIPGPAGAAGAPGGGGGSATTVETDIGSTPKAQGKFTITDAGIAPTSKVLCWQAPGPYTGKGTRADEAEMQPVSVIAVEPGSGSAVVKWQTPPMIILRPRAQHGSQPVTAVIPGLKDPDAIAGGSALRIGRVKGNVRFSYLVFA